MWLLTRRFVPSEAASAVASASVDVLGRWEAARVPTTPHASQMDESITLWLEHIVLFPHRCGFFLNILFSGLHRYSLLATRCSPEWDHMALMHTVSHPQPAIASWYQDKNWRGLGVWPPGAMVDPFWKSAKMGLGSVLDNFQLNNSLTQ